MIKKNKMTGFSLIELLVIIVILAFIAVITIPIIQHVIQNSKEKAYEQQLHSFERAVEYALSLNLIQYPNTNHIAGSDLTNQDYTLSEMISLNMIGQIIDPRTGNLCDSLKSYVRVTESNNGYEFSPNLVCSPNQVLTISSTPNFSNTIAQVDIIDGNTVTYSNLQFSDLTGNFEVNDKIALLSTNDTDYESVGSYDFFTIHTIQDSTITVNKNIDTNKYNNQNSQIIKLISSDIIEIKENVILKPKEYNGRIGGIIAIEATQKLTIEGRIDASFTGYKRGYSSPLNGELSITANSSSTGGSNQYTGGNGGSNYQGTLTQNSTSMGYINMNEKLYMGGGSRSSIGGGIVYIKTEQLEINHSQSISANGQGGIYVSDGGAAGGSIFIKASSITNKDNLNYFVGATGGGGGGETYEGGAFPSRMGSNGTNLGGGNGASSNVSGGSSFGPNGGGGSKYSSPGLAATGTSGGNGAGFNSTSGWNAGAGGGSGGYIGFELPTSQKQIVENIILYPAPFFYSPENPTDVIYADTTNTNTSAEITNISDHTLTIGSTLNGTLTGSFSTNDSVLLVATKGTSASGTGFYEKYTIVEVNGSNITLDRTINTSKFTIQSTQMVKIAKYHDLLVYGTLSPANYDGKKGGILALEVTNQLIVNGNLDVSFKGYLLTHESPNSGKLASSGNASSSGGSNQFTGGAGGTNYQGITTAKTPSIGPINLQEKLYMGGGSRLSRGGGILYIEANRTLIQKQQSLSANGKGGIWVNDAGAAGGSVLLKTNQLVSAYPLSHFIGATGGGGGGETYENNTFPPRIGLDGTNLGGGQGASSNVSGGLPHGSNGGGGAKYGNTGFSATATSAGNGATHAGTNGWNSGAGGGSGGYIGIITNDSSKLTGIATYPAIQIYPY